MPMLNLKQIRDDVARAPGNFVGMTKQQVEQLLDAAEVGQRAQAAIINLSSLAAASARAVGSPS